MLGRIIYGFANGALATATMACVNEYCPGKHQGIGMGLWVANQNFGSFIALMAGLFLPEDEYNPDDE